MYDAEAVKNCWIYFGKLCVISPCPRTSAPNRSSVSRCLCFWVQCCHVIRKQIERQSVLCPCPIQRNPVRWRVSFVWRINLFAQRLKFEVLVENSSQFLSIESSLFAFDLALKQSARSCESIQTSSNQLLFTFSTHLHATRSHWLQPLTPLRQLFLFWLNFAKWQTFFTTSIAS